MIFVTQRGNVAFREALSAFCIAPRNRSVAAR